MEKSYFADRFLFCERGDGGFVIFLFFGFKSRLIRLYSLHFIPNIKSLTCLIYLLQPFQSPPLSSIHPSNTPPSFNPFHNSGSKNFPTLTSPLNPFRLRVLTTKSLAVACTDAISSGRSLISRSSGSPGTTLHLSKTKATLAWPWVWIRTSVSKPKLSMTGTRPRTPYSGVPARGPSERTWPRRRARMV